MTVREDGEEPLSIQQQYYPQAAASSRRPERLRASERSPFHARRLAGIDPGRFEPGQLAELPVMTKQQMMANFDELLTDHDVTLARVEQQLAACADEPSRAGPPRSRCRRARQSKSRRAGSLSFAAEDLGSFTAPGKDRGGSTHLFADSPRQSTAYRPDYPARRRPGRPQDVPPRRARAGLFAAKGGGRRRAARRLLNSSLTRCGAPVSSRPTDHLGELSTARRYGRWLCPTTSSR
jgi:hypothetical protein